MSGGGWIAIARDIGEFEALLVEGIHDLGHGVM
jgi:hypothetical protein